MEFDLGARFSLAFFPRASTQQGHSKKVCSMRMNLLKASRLGLWLRFGREARWGSGTASRPQEQAEVHFDQHGGGRKGRAY